MIYTIPYLILLLFLFSVAVYYEQTEDDDIRNKINYGCLMLMLVFFGFRGFVFDDWQIYYILFQDCSFEDVWYNVYTYKNARWTCEPGFTLLMATCKGLFDSYYFFNFVCTVIVTVLLFNFFKQQKFNNFPFALILYLCFGGIIMSVNLMRNSIAIMIFINAIKYIEERRPVPYFLLCLLAISFHLSALMYLPLYFFLHRRFSKWVFAGIFLAGNFVFLTHTSIFLNVMSLFIGTDSGRLSEMLKDYTSGTLGTAAGISIGYLERLFTSFLVFCYYDKLSTVRKNNTLFINSFILYFAMTFFFSEFKEASVRMSYLFIFAYWILWKDLIVCFSVENNRKLYISFLFTYCMLKMMGHTDVVTSQYDNVLFGAKSYEERLYIHNRYGEQM